MNEEKEQMDLIKMYNDIRDHYDRQISRIHKAYALVSSLITALLITGGIIFYSNISDFKTSLQSETDILKKSMENDIKTYGQSLKSDTNKELEAIRGKVSEKIENEFNTDNIRALVERKARERIDIVADDFIENQIEIKISSKIQQTERSLKQLINKTIDELDYMKYQLIVTSAMNDNRASYDTLVFLSQTQNYKYKKDAENSVMQILNEYSQPEKYFGAIYMSAKTGDRLKYKFNDYKEYFKSSPKESRIDIIQAIWEREDFNFYNKIKFLINVIKVDQSLKVVSTASSYIIRYYKLGYKTLEIDNILEWYSNQS